MTDQEIISPVLNAACPGSLADRLGHDLAWAGTRPSIRKDSTQSDE